MKSSHIPKKKKEGSVLYGVCTRAVAGEISSSANDLWDDYFGGFAILHCPQEGLLRCMHEARRRPPCSVFSMEHPVRWIMDHGHLRSSSCWYARLALPVFRTDIASGLPYDMHSPYMFGFCYFWISQTIIFSPLQCNTSHCNFQSPFP